MSLVTLRPLAQSVLYLPQSCNDASPKAISGRTSYLQVRLAFHPYPQVIQNFCNSYWFAPPRRVNSASRCPWVAHLVSCLIHATPRPFKLAFASPPGVAPLSLRHG